MKIRNKIVIGAITAGLVLWMFFLWTAHQVEFGEIKPSGDNNSEYVFDVLICASKEALNLAHPGITYKTNLSEGYIPLHKDLFPTDQRSFCSFAKKHMLIPEEAGEPVEYEFIVDSFNEARGDQLMITGIVTKKDDMDISFAQQFDLLQNGGNVKISKIDGIPFFVLK